MINQKEKMDTICAIATPAGGALGIIRVSGPEAITAADRIFRPRVGAPLSQRAASSLTFGNVVVPQTDETVDEVLVSLFRAPHSYTGEDSVEFSCHGSYYILNKVVELLLAQGCRMARPGEYTERAFLNGKMDLSQAEAVADLIASTTEANHRMAMQQMRGGFSKELRTLRDQLLHITSLLELELDFSDHEELEFASRSELLALAERIRNHISTLCQSFRLGNALKRGVPVALVGETNAGKSTLLNALVGEERALVSNVHGTTRDTIEETVNVGGTLVRFIDTAGIRETSDTVERMGIERTFDKMAEADIVLWLIDLTVYQAQYDELAEKIGAQVQGKHLVVLLNKTDLVSESTINEAKQYISGQLNNAVPTPMLLTLSAQSGSGLDQLKQLLAASLSTLQAENNSTGTIVSNLRHYEALSAALAATDRVIEGLHQGLSGDFVSQDLRECIYHLSDIVGEVTTDQVLGNIFKHFCVGK
uniref:tRNA uridine-5-carboxymethylaminomethyl(34) synthesis GTPase MnmE n=1 Tax=Alloprevotella sp. TaxID=1872471 RepID=UPI0040251309